MKIYICAFVCIIGIISCGKTTENYYQKYDIVDITQASVPDTTHNLQPVNISVRAEAGNDCWQKLYFEFKKYNEFEYTLRAYGIVNTDGNCPITSLTEDSVITFTPTKKGTYIFYITRYMPQIEIDTLIAD